MKLKHGVCSECESDLDGIKLSVGNFCPKCGALIEELEW